MPWMPRSCASHSAAERSGPSPTSTSCAGISRTTCAKIFTTSTTRFTGLKFERCIRIASSGAARRGALPLALPRP